MIKLQLDTASDISIISENTFKQLCVKNATEVKDSQKCNSKLPLSSQFECSLKFRDKRAMVTCYVTPLNDLNVLGLDWIQALKLNEMTIDNMT